MHAAGSAMVSDRVSQSTEGIRLDLWARYKRGGDIVLFTALWLVVALAIGQDRAIARGEPVYWAIVLPAVFFPLVRAKQTVTNLILGPARPILAFGILAVLWLIANRDAASVPAVVLFVWVAGWSCREEIRLQATSLLGIGIALYVTAAVITCLSSAFGPNYDVWPMNNNAIGFHLNPWGVLPGSTIPEFRPWRVSATPNIATSAVFSLLLLMIAMKQPRRTWLWATALSLSTYFTLLSFVRAILVGLGMFATTLLGARLFVGRPSFQIACALSVFVLTVLTVTASPLILFELQGVDIVSRVFLRGQSGLSVSDIYLQLYRPGQWVEHFKLFFASDYLMGHGKSLVTTFPPSPGFGTSRSDSESLLTRLLAMYGLPAIGVFVFLTERGLRHARNGDTWAVACVATLVWLMMTWGSVFHPSNGLFVLAFLIIGRGSNAFAPQIIPSHR